MDCNVICLYRIDAGQSEKLAVYQHKRGAAYLLQKRYKDLVPILIHKVDLVQGDANLTANTLCILQVSFNRTILIPHFLCLVPIPHEYAKHIMPADQHASASHSKVHSRESLVVV